METLALPARKTDRFLRMGMSKNLSRFREWQRGYEPVVIKLVFGVFLYDNS